MHRDVATGDYLHMKSGLSFVPAAVVGQARDRGACPDEAKQGQGFAVGFGVWDNGTSISGPDQYRSVAASLAWSLPAPRGSAEKREDIHCPMYYLSLCPKVSKYLFRRVVCCATAGTALIVPPCPICPVVCRGEAKVLPGDKAPWVIRVRDLARFSGRCIGNGAKKLDGVTHAA